VTLTQEEYVLKCTTLMVTVPANAPGRRFYLPRLTAESILWEQISDDEVQQANWEPTEYEPRTVYISAYKQVRE
jgi:hypothetical protein